VLVREARKRPPAWPGHRASVRFGWLTPLHAIEWAFDWIAYYLSRWAFLEVLEYLGVFSVLVAVIFYFSESGDRQKQKHYQAWQVINTAQGKGGSGGRTEALRELNADRVSLTGVDLSGAFLQGVELSHADLLRANFEAADLRNSVLSGSNLEYATLRSANFRRANLTDANLERADLQDSDLVGATLAGSELERRQSRKRRPPRNSLERHSVRQGCEPARSPER
jgi:Pentapeptide repeats (8 copies)